MATTGAPEGVSWPPEIEGALTAHRRLLELLLATLALARGDGVALLDDIERQLGYGDHQEDPGAEPDAAYAIERAADAELRRLLRSARSAVLGAETGAERSQGL